MKECQVIIIRAESPVYSDRFIKQRDIIVKLHPIGILSRKHICTGADFVIRTIPSDRAYTHNLHTGLGDVIIPASRRRGGNEFKTATIKLVLINNIHMAVGI